MKRFFNVMGAVLMVCGLALLSFVGVLYAQSRTQSNPTAPGWTASQKAKARQIAAELSHSQKIAIPRSLAHKSAPAPGSEVATRIVIPKINVNAPVVETPPVQGIWEVADWAVGHLSTTPNPGGAGNDALSAHDDIKGELFKRLGELGPGDSVLLYTRHAVYTYTVIRQQAVDPSNISVLNPTARPTVTLISCVPYWVDTQRLVVQAVLKSESAV